MKNKILYVLLVLIICVMHTGTAHAQADSQVFSSGELRVQSVGRGELLPVEIQLVNFGTPNDRVDATLIYSIVYQKDNVELFRTTETVAVETTASFNRDIIIPGDFPYGDYVVSVDVKYRDQIFPAISQSSFTVVRKIFGYPLSDWIHAVLLFVVVLLITLFIQQSQKKKHNHVPASYTHVDENQRIYYEIIHGIIHEIHYHVGDAAISRITNNIPGLIMSQDGEHVKEISIPIIEIIPLLMQKYHEVSGKNLNVVLDPGYEKKRVTSH